ncbi:MAG: polyprenyl synthetase family protein [Pseudomonadota bacterium]
MPAPDTSFRDRLVAHASATDHYLTEIISQQSSGERVPERLRDAVKHAVLSGGKRLRPFLVIESAQLFGVSRDRALPVAAALECIHCYSLVHDDLPAMDNDTLRRGQPTVWSAFDEWTAILAGDALLTLAFEILSDPLNKIGSAEHRLALTQRLATASGWLGMVGGQCIDLEADKLGQPKDPDEAHVRKLQSMKTGALICFAVEAGAILGDATPDQFAAISRYGRALGLAFQIADDLLDVEGSADVVGKATGKDAEAGKATLIGVLGLNRARQELEAAHDDAHRSLAQFGPEADMLRATAGFVIKRDR